MGRPSPWLLLVVLLLGVLVLRESRLQQLDDVFQAWFLEHTEAHLPPAHVTLVEVTRQDLQSFPVLAGKGNETEKTARKKTLRRTPSPLEYALFLQAAMEFEPAVIAIEPILIWKDKDKDQEQVFLDQAMRVPKLLVAMRLGEKGPREIPTDDLFSFSQVTGRRGELAEYPGVSHRPDDDIRLISTPGFINLPNDRSDRIRLPMLFDYKGEIVPSFPLQAVLLWLRLLPSEVKVELGHEIDLPNGWKIPLYADGTTMINPMAAESVRHLSLNQLLLAAQERERRHPLTTDLAFLKDQILVLRLADDPLQPPNIFATAIATIQTNAYVGRVREFVDWLVLLAVFLFAFLTWRVSKVTLVLSAAALAAGYSLIVLSLLGQNRLWLPALPFLALLALLTLVRLLMSATTRPAAVKPLA